MKITKKLPELFAIHADKINTKNLIISSLKRTKIHNHHDKECWHIRSGEGILLSNNHEILVQAGDYIEFFPFEPHVVKNQGPEDLCFTSYWYVDWVPILADADLHPQSDSKTMIETAFPTPNGPLHLGHLSGAYLMSDIQKRCYELIGSESFSYCGTYGHTNHIDKTAAAKKTSYNDLVFTSEQVIYNDFKLFQVNYDFLLPHYPSLNNFEKSKTKFIHKITSSSYIIEREIEHPYSEQLGEFICESYVAGKCPHCGEITIGIECESCGLYQDECKLIEPFHAITKEKLVHKTVKRLYLRIEENLLSDLLVKIYCNNIAMSRVCYDSGIEYINTGNLKDIPVSSLRSKGIPIYGEQTLSIVMERALRSYHGLSEYPAANRHLFFCGFDNMCGSGILMPYILKTIGVSNDQLPIAIVNYFCLLENKKFSTGSNHAIWANEFLSSYPSDLARLYLSHIQNSTRESNFSIKALYELSEKFIENLTLIFDKGKDLIEHHEGSIEAGPWLQQDTIFYRELNETMEYCIKNLINCSLQIAVKRVFYLLDTIHDYLIESRNYQKNNNYFRTRLALIIYAYQCLIFCLYPIMPKLSSKIMYFLNIEFTILQSQKSTVRIIDDLNIDEILNELSHMKNSGITI